MKLPVIAFNEKAYAKSQGERMKLDCVRCNKCGKIHSVEKGCDLPEAGASAERISSVKCCYWHILKKERIQDV